jgi:hypothetical protein
MTAPHVTWIYLDARCSKWFRLDYRSSNDEGDSEFDFDFDVTLLRKYVRISGGTRLMKIFVDGKSSRVE